MKWPIDIAVWVMVNLEKRDFDEIHEVLLHIAKKLQLNAVDCEQISMAIRIVKSHPVFLEDESIEAAKETLLKSDEGREIYSVIEEIKGSNMQASVM